MEKEDLIHDHLQPLIDVNVDVDCKKVNCDVCNKLQWSRSKLPRKIQTYPMHSEHPLLLSLKRWSNSRNCNSCQKRLHAVFYTCSSCKFYVCVVCARGASKERKIKLDCHPHQLILLPRKANFYCDACDLECCGMSSYTCMTCSFWIHKDCASLPNSYKNKHHHHPLSLAYNVPMELRHYKPYCNICYKTLEPLMWVYFCGRCRFFVHLKCRDSSPPLRSDEESSSLPDVHDVIQFPWKDTCNDVIRPFIEKNKSQKDIQPREEIKHFSHEHPLSLSDLPTDNENNIDPTLCAACVEPISSAPYYTCSQCRYLLHKSCAYLPTELQHPFHPEHQLSLRKLNLQEQRFFHCGTCNAKSNGFFFECEAWQFRLDLNCAILPRFIKHEAHNQHVLVRKKATVAVPFYGCSCNACRKDLLGDTAYCCGYCIGFDLHLECATLPKTVTHRWDKHQLILMYPPFGDHPEEMYCEICEEEIHPQWNWMYHCRECDQSFHPFCIPRIGKNRHIRFGETVKADDHPHTLTSVREGKFKSNCARCGVILSGEKTFECGLCKFSLCYKCICNVPSEPL